MAAPIPHGLRRMLIKKRKEDMPEKLNISFELLKPDEKAEVEGFKLIPAHADDAAESFCSIFTRAMANQKATGASLEINQKTGTIICSLQKARIKTFEVRPSPADFAKILALATMHRQYRAFERSDATHEVWVKFFTKLKAAAAPAKAS